MIWARKWQVKKLEVYLTEKVLQTIEESNTVIDLEFLEEKQETEQFKEDRYDFQSKEKKWRKTDASNNEHRKSKIWWCEAMHKRGDAWSFDTNRKLGRRVLNFRSHWYQ